MNFSIFSSLLPEGLLTHFDIVDFKELGDLPTKKDCFYIYLDEKNIYFNCVWYNKYPKIILKLKEKLLKRKPKSI